MLPIRYAYLVGDLVFLAIWLLLFWKRKDVRKEMLVMSVVTGLAGPISEYWYFKDCWRPTIVLGPFWPWGWGLEDIFFGFAIGGIAAVIYEVLLRKKLACPRAEEHQNWALLIFPLIVAVAMISLTDIYGLNSVYSSSVAFLFIFGIMLKVRPNLFKDAVISGLLVALLMFVFYFLYLPLFPHILGRTWLIYDTPHWILVFDRVPLTEMLWALTWGMAGGPLYEFWRGCKLKPV